MLVGPLLPGPKLHSLISRLVPAANSAAERFDPMDHLFLANRGTLSQRSHSNSELLPVRDARSCAQRDLHCHSHSLDAD